MRQKLLPAFNLRLPADVRRLLEQAAEEHGRSLNAEIVYRLQQTLAGYRR